MRRSVHWLLAVSLMSSADEASGQVAGLCLDMVETGPWYVVQSRGTAEQRYWQAIPSNEDPFYSLPARVELGSEDRGSGQLVLLIPPNSQEVPHSFRLWRTIGDTLEIVLSNGYSGISVRLGRGGPGWTGILRTTTDAIGTMPYARAVALTESSCDSPPAVPLSADPPLPRTVELEGGLSIVLGETLPERIPAEERLWPPDGALMVLPRVEGTFAGADTVIVHLSNATRRVYWIDMRYPKGFNSEALASALTTEIGRPGRIEWRFHWANRTTSVTMIPPGPQSPRGPRVTLMDPRWENERPR